MGSLAERLEEYLDESSGIEQVERFTVTDKDSADWAVRKIVKHKSNIEEAKRIAANRIQIINAWLKKEVEESQNQIAFFESILRPFAEQALKGEKKKKSFKLPSGVVGFREASTKFLIDGETVSGENVKLTNWIKRNQPEYLVVKEKTNWSEFKETLKTHDGKAVTADGEVVPGIITETPPDNLYVKGV